MEKYIAVGDIHSSFDQLLELYEQIKNFKEHKIVFLGDYIDRGSEPAKVINFLKELDAIFIMGNHEMMLFDICTLLKEEGEANKEKFVDYLHKRGITYDDFLWLYHNCKIKHETEEYIFSHGGINPDKSLEENTHHDFLWSTTDKSLHHVTDKLVIHGHISVENVTITGNNINIDTGCGKGGYLSTIVLPEMKILKSKTTGKNHESLL